MTATVEIVILKQEIAKTKERVALLEALVGELMEAKTASPLKISTPEVGSVVVTAPKKKAPRKARTKK